MLLVFILTGKLLQKVNSRAVIESVHRVQAQSIHVVIGQPHQCIVDQIAADFGRAGFFKIDGAAPQGRLPWPDYA